MRLMSLPFPSREVIALNVPHFIGGPVSRASTWVLGVFVGS